MEKEHAGALDYGITMAVQTLVEAMGMMSENLQRLQKGQTIAYTDKEFDELIERNGCHHNGAVGRWMRI